MTELRSSAPCAGALHRTFHGPCLLHHRPVLRYCSSQPWLAAARGGVLLHAEGRDTFLTCILKSVRDTGRSRKHGVILMSKHENFFSGSEKCVSDNVWYGVIAQSTAH